MNMVFERFVEAVVRREARKAGFVFEGQARRKLTASVTMKPDLLVREGARDVAVGDAKYKELAPAAWPHADLYQLIAYCDALQLRRGLLIYAGSRRPRAELVKGTNVLLEIIGIDLTGDHRAVLARARSSCQAAATCSATQTSLACRGPLNRHLQFAPRYACAGLSAPRTYPSTSEGVRERRPRSSPCSSTHTRSTHRA
ncbi:MAG: McrC family protein [Actinomycetota bacterium]|nr:McrC family protein [Actinomycetota bacterium]